MRPWTVVSADSDGGDFGVTGSLESDHSCLWNSQQVQRAPHSPAVEVLSDVRWKTKAVSWVTKFCNGSSPSILRVRTAEVIASGGSGTARRIVGVYDIGELHHYHRCVLIHGTRSSSIEHAFRRYT